MKNYKIITKSTPQGEETSKLIYEIPADQAKHYKSLGVGIGISVEHCFFMGLHHKENFWERAYGYIVSFNDEAKKISEVTKDKYVSVEFFEQNIIENLDNLEDWQIAMIWYLHEAEALTEKLSDRAIEQINEYVKREKQKNPNAEIWEIDFFPTYTRPDY